MTRAIGGTTTDVSSARIPEMDSPDAEKLRQQVMEAKLLLASRNPFARPLYDLVVRLGGQAPELSEAYAIMLGLTNHAKE